MRFDYLLISFIVFTVFVVGGSFMIGDINNKYENTGINISDEDFGEVYNTIDSIYEDAEGVKEKTLEGEIKDTESWESMTKGSYSAIRLVSGSFKLFTDITNAISKKIGIPAFITRAAFIIFSLLITFGLIYMIFRYKD